MAGAAPQLLVGWRWRIGRPAYQQIVRSSRSVSLHVSASDHCGVRLACRLWLAHSWPLLSLLLGGAVILVGLGNEAFSKLVGGVPEPVPRLLLCAVAALCQLRQPARHKTP